MRPTAVLRDGWLLRGSCRNRANNSTQSHMYTNAVAAARSSKLPLEGALRQSQTERSRSTAAPTQIATSGKWYSVETSPASLCAFEPTMLRLLGLMFCAPELDHAAELRITVAVTRRERSGLRQLGICHHMWCVCSLFIEDKLLCSKFCTTCGFIKVEHNTLMTVNDPHPVCHSHSGAQHLLTASAEKASCYLSSVLTKTQSLESQQPPTPSKGQ